MWWFRFLTLYTFVYLYLFGYWRLSWLFLIQLLRFDLNRWLRFVLLSLLLFLSLSVFKLFKFFYPVFIYSLIELYKYCFFNFSFLRLVTKWMNFPILSFRLYWILFKFVKKILFNLSKSRSVIEYYLFTSQCYYIFFLQGWIVFFKSIFTVSLINIQILLHFLNLLYLPLFHFLINLKIIHRYRHVYHSTICWLLNHHLTHFRLAFLFKLLNHLAIFQIIKNLRLPHIYCIIETPSVYSHHCKLRFKLHQHHSKTAFHFILVKYLVIMALIIGNYLSH